MKHMKERGGEENLTKSQQQNKTLRPTKARKATPIQNTKPPKPSTRSRGKIT